MSEVRWARARGAAVVEHGNEILNLQERRLMDGWAGIGGAWYRNGELMNKSN